MSILGLMQSTEGKCFSFQKKGEFILNAYFINPWYHLLVGLPSNPYVKTVRFEIVLMLISTPRRGRDMNERLGYFL